jgi:hypothetical protein
MRNLKALSAAACLLCVGLAACAGLAAREVDTTNTVRARSDENLRGIRYYLPAPYILVYSNGPGRLAAEYLVMPDLDRTMSVDPYSILASNKSKLTFQNGMLTSGASNADATVIPMAVIEALKTAAIARANLDSASTGAETRALPPPYLYRIISDEHGTRLAGGAPDPFPAINVSVVPGAPVTAPAPKASETKGAKGDAQ